MADNALGCLAVSFKGHRTQAIAPTQGKGKRKNANNANAGCSDIAPGLAPGRASAPFALFASFALFAVRLPVA
jgi:hypothetical protein